IKAKSGATAARKPTIKSGATAARKRTTTGASTQPAGAGAVAADYVTAGSRVRGAAQAYRDANASTADLKEKLYNAVVAKGFYQVEVAVRQIYSLDSAIAITVEASIPGDFGRIDDVRSLLSGIAYGVGWQVKTDPSFNSIVFTYRAPQGSKPEASINPTRPRDMRDDYSARAGDNSNKSSGWNSFLEGLGLSTPMVIAAAGLVGLLILKN